MSRARTVIGALLAAAACAPAQELKLPDPPVNAKTLLLALDPPRCESGTCAFAQLYEGTAPDSSLVLPAGEAKFFAAYFEDDLATLALQPGPLEVCFDGSPHPECARGVRFLPAPEVVYGAAQRGTELDVFALETSLPPSIAELAVPEIDRIECIESGRCFGPYEESTEPDQLRCVPCADPPTPVRPFAPSSVTPVEKPRFACPLDWVSRELEHATVCDPPEPVQELDCPSDQFQFYGAGAEASCVSPGDVCPSGNFPNLPPGAIYVLAGATGQTGAINDPFGSLEEALLIAPAGQTIAVGPGFYTACAIDAVTIRGVCAARVVIDAQTCTQGHLRLSGAARLSNATIEGTIELEPASTVELEGLLVRGHTHAGIVALSDCSLLARDLAITDCSQAISLFAGSAQLQRVAITESTLGIGSFDSARTAIEELRVSHTTYPVLVRNGSELDLSRAELRSVSEEVIGVQGASLFAADLSASAGPGFGLAPILSADTGGTIIVDRAVFRGARGIAVSINGGGEIIARFNDLVIAGVAREGVRGHGIETSGNVELRLERTLIEDAPVRGLSQSGTGSRLEATDLVILPGVEVTETGISLGGAEASIHKLYLTGTGTAAVALHMSELDLTDATLIDHRNNSLLATADSTLDVRRTYAEAVANAGVRVDQSSRAIVRDFDAGDVRAAFAGEGSFDVAGARVVDSGCAYRGENGSLVMQDAQLIRSGLVRPVFLLIGGTLSLTRVALEDFSMGGVLAKGSATVTLTDVSAAGETFYPALEVSGPSLGTTTTIRRSIFSGGASTVRLCASTATMEELEVLGGSIGVELDASFVGLRNFRITGANRGLVFSGDCVGPSSLIAQNGLVSASEVALEAPESLELGDAFYQVVYDAPVPIKIISE